MRHKRKLRKYLIQFMIGIFCAIVLIFGQADLGLSDLIDNKSWHSDNISDALPTSESLEEVKLIRIVDGDTIVVKKSAGEEEKVRLLEIDTPESVASNTYLKSTGKTNCIEGRIASDFTKKVLSDREVVYLEYDQEKEDRYGRTLAYVWLDQDVDVNDTDDISQFCLNAILLKEGMAECVIYEPNVRHQNIFMMLENNAKEQRIGLWGNNEYI